MGCPAPDGLGLVPLPDTAVRPAQQEGQAARARGWQAAGAGGGAAGARGELC